MDKKNIKQYSSGSKISALAEEERPREKLLLKGKGTLSNAELIAALIGSGTKEMGAVELAREILREVNNDLNQLAKLGVKDLQKFKGVGEVKAISIISALELGRRRKPDTGGKQIRVTSPDEVYDQVKAELMDEVIEYFYILLLSRRNVLIRKQCISQGGTACTIVDPKLVFRYALQYNASSLILVHNHPSGQLKPSQADIRLTNRLKELGEELQLPVLDHVIFADHGYFSFVDEEMM